MRTRRGGAPASGMWRSVGLITLRWSHSSTVSQPPTVDIERGGLRLQYGLLGGGHIQDRHEHQDAD